MVSVVDVGAVCLLIHLAALLMRPLPIVPCWLVGGEKKKIIRIIIIL